jgi:hypothetical protein
MKEGQVFSGHENLQELMAFFCIAWRRRLFSWPQVDIQVALKILGKCRIGYALVFPREEEGRNNAISRY